jgi:hypothetical protein
LAQSGQFLDQFLCRLGLGHLPGAREDPNELLPVWEYTAGWFTTNTGLDNSTLLMPIKGDNSKYGVINHCRWDKLSSLLPKLIFEKTIRSYVGANFAANKIASMPILYRLIRNYSI